MRIDTAGNVGIGTTGGAGKLQVKAATNQNLVVQGSVSLANSVVISAVNDAASANVPLEFRYGTNTAFIQDGTERMRIDSSGNVGIGTSSPTQKVSIAGGLSFNSTLSFTGSGYEIGKDGADFLCFSSGTAGARFVSSSTATEFMRIDSAGNMQLGSASTPEPARLFVSSTSVSAVPCVVQQTAAGATNQNSVVFYRNSASTGSISATATTTAYNTSSDYRLKENVQPMQNALAIISALKPSTYDWIGHDESGEGFLAHELQEIIPIAVMGVKDAVNDDGSIKAQGVDHSKIVVHLVAAIQEQQAMIIALTARITALEVTP